MAEKSTTTVPCGGATFIGYYRVSTPRQAASGLGFDAQREAVQKYVSGLNGRLEAEYWEVASGADAGRFELARALEHCRRAGAVLAVSCIDRLARSVAVYVSVWKSGVSFVACDKPEAGDLEVYADVVKAGEERRLVSARTRAALQAAKARGVRLGCPLGASAFGERSRQGASDAVKAKADSFAQSLASMVLPLRAQGLSLRAIADRLNAECILTAQKKAWQAASVRNLLGRLDRLGMA